MFCTFPPTGRLSSFSTIRAIGGWDITELKRLAAFRTLGEDDVRREDGWGIGPAAGILGWGGAVSVVALPGLRASRAKC